MATGKVWNRVTVLTCSLLPYKIGWVLLNGRARTLREKNRSKIFWSLFYLRPSLSGMGIKRDEIMAQLFESKKEKANSWSTHGVLTEGSLRAHGVLTEGSWSTQ